MPTASTPRPALIVDDGQRRDAIGYLLDVLNDPHQPPDRRDRCAIALLPHSRDPSVAARLSGKAKAALDACTAGENSEWDSGGWGNDLDPNWQPPSRRN
jgi:hypothetical protein